MVGKGDVAMTQTETKEPSADDRQDGETPTCFVLMPFMEPYNAYFNSVIAPAIKECGLDPQRGDSIFKAGVVMADIWRLVNKAQVLLAELTTKNPNVFYELGLAHAIGKPVVLISETLEDVPFDLRALRVLPYDKNDPSWGDALKARIRKAVTETLADPIEAVPPIYRKTIPSDVPTQPEVRAEIDEVKRRLRQLEAESGQERLVRQMTRVTQGRHTVAPIYTSTALDLVSSRAIQDE